MLIGSLMVTMVQIIWVYKYLCVRGSGSPGGRVVVEEELFIRPEAVGADGSISWDKLVRLTEETEDGRDETNVYNLTQSYIHSDVDEAHTLLGITESVLYRYW